MCPPVLLIVVSITLPLLGSSGLLVKGADVPQVCSVKSFFHSPFITPFWEDSVPVTGCSSRALAHRSQEVHVIYLKNDEESASRHRVPVVTLHVKPLAEHSVHAGRLIIILHAQRTVSWRLVGERISNNASHHTIVVTRGSQIIENKNLQIMVMRRKETAVSRLIKWVTRRYKALTSYAEMSESNKVLLKVGVSDNAPRECNTDKRSISSNVDAVLAKAIADDQQEGCVVDINRSVQRPDVHVIYVHDVGSEVEEEQSSSTTSASTNDGHKTVVNLEVRSKSMKAVEKNLVLFLKARQPVVWVIRSDDVQGVLKIVTEDPVERLHVAPSHLIHVKTEELPDTPEDLLFYADNKNGPLRSYLEVRKANKFQILLSDGDVSVNSTPAEPKLPRQILWPPAGPATTAPSIPSSKDFLKAQLGSIRSSKATGVQVLMKSHGRISPEDLIRMPNVLLMEAMQVDCFPQYMRVSFPRLMLERLGIHGNDMSLNSPACRVSSNDSHLVLSTYFKGCGTETKRVDERVIYKNAVNFHFITKKVASGVISMTSFKESDLLIDDEDHNLENGSGIDQDTWKKKEDGDEQEEEEDTTQNYLKPKTLEFQCEYLASGMPVNTEDEIDQPFNVTSPHWQIYGMDVYRDSEYKTPFKPTDYPTTILANDRLYVESRIDAGPNLRVVTEECWLSCSPNITDQERTPLIKQTCPVDLSVQVQRAGQPLIGVRPSGGNTGANVATIRQWNRFNFQVNTKSDSVYLHCLLGVCSVNPRHSTGNVKQCIDIEEYCLGKRVNSFTDQAVGTHHEVLTRGPIKVIPTANLDPSLVPFMNREKKPDMQSVPAAIDRIDEKILIQEPQVIFTNGLSTEMVVGIAIISFVIGIIFTAVLWFIHAKTDPMRNGRTRTATTHHSGYDLSAHSGSSTPSSQVPMTT